MRTSRFRLMITAGALVVSLLTFGAGPVDALDTGNVAGKSVQLSQYGSAVYTNYPGGYFNVRVEPYGGLYDNDLQSWSAAGVVYDASPCNNDTVWLWLGGEDSIFSPTAVDPTGTVVSGSVTGQAYSPCWGHEDPFTLSFTMAATGAPRSGGLPPRAPGYNYAYVERDGLATGTFCWGGAHTGCTNFGQGNSAIGYILITQT